MSTKCGVGFITVLSPSLTIPLVLLTLSITCLSLSIQYKYGPSIATLVICAPSNEINVLLNYS